MLLSVCASACLNTQSRRVQLKEDIIKEQRRLRAQRLIKKTMKETLVENMERRKQLVIPEAIRLSEVHRLNTRRRIRAVINDAPKDPFEAYEKDRERVIEGPSKTLRPKS